MSRATAGFNFVMGIAGGLTGMGTGAPSASGAAGTVIGMGARQRVQEMQRGGPFRTTQQVGRTQHFAGTGQHTPPPTG
jgi:hypothetical protein